MNQYVNSSTNHPKKTVIVEKKIWIKPDIEKIEIKNLPGRGRDVLEASVS